MRRRWRQSIVIGLALLVLFGPVAVELYTDWLWFEFVADVLFGTLLSALLPKHDLRIRGYNGRRLNR